MMNKTKNKQAALERLATLKLIPENFSAELMHEARIRLRQTDNCARARLTIRGIEAYFYSTCEIVSPATMYLDEISGDPEWSSSVAWKLIPQNTRRASVSENPCWNEIRDLLFAPASQVQIPGNFRPGRFVLLGSSTLLFNQLSALPNVETLPLQFIFTNGVLIHSEFVFHVMQQASLDFRKKLRDLQISPTLTENENQHGEESNIVVGDQQHTIQQTR